jgi:hypothetical protein
MSVVKLLITAIGGLVALVLVGVAYHLGSDYRAYQKAEITTALLRDGRYDPAQHFRFDRACVFPPESVLADTWLSQRGYQEIDAIFPDTYTNWTLVLIDDQERTFRTLYILESKIKFGGKVICNPNTPLRIASTNGNTVAYVDEVRAN